VECFLSVNTVFLHCGSMYLIPYLDVETKIDMEELVMLVVEVGIGLPGLPPLRLEVDTGVVDYAMVIGVDGYHIEGEPMDWDGEQRQAHSQLDVHDLHRVNGCDGEGSGLFVLVMQLMEMLVQEGGVVHSVHYVGRIVLIYKYNRKLQEEPSPPILIHLVVDGAGVTIVDVAGQGG